MIAKWLAMFVLHHHKAGRLGSIFEDKMARFRGTSAISFLNLSRGVCVCECVCLCVRVCVFV